MLRLVIYRNYMAQDIMRRILRDYFGYEVQFVMNITDVDDKVRSSSLKPSTRTQGQPLNSFVICRSFFELVTRT